MSGFYLAIRLMKKRIIIIIFVTVILFFLFLIISSSFENIYMYKDQYIILANKNENTEYSYCNRENGTVQVVEGKITFLLKNQVVATADYDPETRVLVVTGFFDDRNYEQAKFKQIKTMREYFKVLF